MKDEKWDAFFGFCFCIGAVTVLAVGVISATMVVAWGLMPS